MRVLVLFDLAEKPPVIQTLESYADDLRDENWECEAAVLRALQTLGHQPALFGLHGELRPLLEKLQTFSPDLVFNLCEAFRGDRRLEPHVVATLELLGARVTGASSGVLARCKDKALAKELVAAAGVAVPKAIVMPRGCAPAMTLPGTLSFPVFVKPLGLESSMGIARESHARNVRALHERVRFVHERLGQDALVEEFVAGRELSVGLLASPGAATRVFPARELCFDGVAAGQPTFATYRAKWDDDYRKKWGIHGGRARGLGRGAARALEEVARAVAAALRLDGYARLDLRLTPEGQVVFLEGNPNPSLAPDDDFARGAQAAGLSFEDLITEIIKMHPSKPAALIKNGAGETRARPRRARARTSRAARGDCLRPGS